MNNPPTENYDFLKRVGEKVSGTFRKDKYNIAKWIKKSFVEKQT